MVKAPALLLAALAITSCNILQVDTWGQLSPVFQAPQASVSSAALEAYPSVDELARWYCPELIGVGGSIACQAALGSQPAKADLDLVFGVSVDVSNGNDYPLPAAEMLVSLTLFPREADETLGAICVGFCDEGEVSCTGNPLEGQCSSDEPEVRSVEDFLSAAFRVLVLAGTGQLEELRIPTIPAKGSRTLSISLGVDVDALLALLQDVIAGRWTDYLAGGELAVRIPYRVEGTLWVVVEGAAKFPVSFGPFDGEWVIR